MTDTDPELIRKMHKMRPLIYDLYQSQKRLINAVACAKEVINHDARIANDQCFVELLSIFDKALEGIVAPELYDKSALLR